MHRGIPQQIEPQSNALIHDGAVEDASHAREQMGRAVNGR